MHKQTKWIQDMRMLKKGSVQLGNSAGSGSNAAAAKKDEIANTPEKTDVAPVSETAGAAAIGSSSAASSVRGILGMITEISNYFITGSGRKVDARKEAAESGSICSSDAIADSNAGRKSSSDSSSSGGGANTTARCDDALQMKRSTAPANNAMALHRIGLINLLQHIFVEDLNDTGIELSAKLVGNDDYDTIGKGRVIRQKHSFKRDVALSETQMLAWDIVRRSDDMICSILKVQLYPIRYSSY